MENQNPPDQRAAEQQQLQAAKAITEEKVKLCLRLEVWAPRTAIVAQPHSAP